jgi:hypothetical protein
MPLAFPAKGIGLDLRLESGGFRFYTQTGDRLLNYTELILENDRLMEEYSRLVAEHDRLFSHAEAVAKNDRLAAKLRELGVDPDRP